MVQYLVTYSVQTGRDQDHGKWLCNVGIEFFKRQQGFKEIRYYSTLVGSGPDWVLEVDFDSADNLMRALETQEAKDTLEDFEHLVRDLSSKILVPAGAPVAIGA